MTVLSETQVAELRPLIRAAALRVIATAPHTMSLQDLEQEGWLALAACAGRWDPSRGPLAFYASRRVRGAMIDLIRRSYTEEKHAPIEDALHVPAVSEAADIDQARAINRLHKAVEAIADASTRQAVRDRLKGLTVAQSAARARDRTGRYKRRSPRWVAEHLRKGMAELRATLKDPEREKAA